MKLRNKKTGEIYDFKIKPDYDDVTSGWEIENKDFGVRYYNSLAELNEEWEDYKEPIEFWTIDAIRKQVVHIYEQGKLRCFSDEQIANLEELGLKFETEEDAEKAVEKLKAWKRLKDNGFKFESWKRDEKFCGDFTITATDQTSCDDKDLDILFGGEE